MLEWIQEKLSEIDIETVVLPWAVKLAGLVALVFVGLMVAKIVRRLLERALIRVKLDETLAKFFANMARYAILAILGVFCLGIFGIQTASLAALMAAAGFAIGLAFQGSLSNFAAGVMLLVFRPFRIGQVVNVAGVTGKVNEIDLFTTELTTPDNRRLILPNGNIFGSTIENVTHYDTRRVSVPVGVDYDADLDGTRQVLEEAAGRIPGTIDDPAAQVFLSSLGASSVDWEVRVWTRTEDFWDVHQNAVREIKRALDTAGIGIPYPQLDIHMTGTPATP